jgi:hypothetical protein
MHNQVRERGPRRDSAVTLEYSTPKTFVSDKNSGVELVNCHEIEDKSLGEFTHSVPERRGVSVAVIEEVIHEL